jgi:hypothetical protein
VALLRHLGCLVLGAAVALGAVLVHRSAPPLGLLLALASTFAVPWWLLRSVHPRQAATYVAGWLAVLATVAAGRPEGDYLIAGDAPGYLLLASGVVLVVLGLVSFAGGRGPSA